MAPQEALFCSECKKAFANQSNYHRHRRDIHDLEERVIVEYEYDVTFFKCEECRVSFKKNEYLRLHLSHKHNLQFECEELSFGSYQEFKNWLSREETTNNVGFEKLTGVKRSNTEISKIYLNCVRSGKTPEAISNRKRRLKSQGSKKINRYCTSQIIVNHYKDSDKCEVQYYKTHYGHDDNIEHLKTPRRKDIFTSKLLLNVPSEM